jgi:hypothetical protein
MILMKLWNNVINKEKVLSCNYFLSFNDHHYSAFVFSFFFIAHFIMTITLTAPTNMRNVIDNDFLLKQYNITS